MPVANDSSILDAIETQLKTLTWAKVVETENIKLAFSELGEHEVPYIQVYDNGQVFEHQSLSFALPPRIR
jgi:regulatory protein YycI of two-component signal transduction system YycFG